MVGLVSQITQSIGLDSELSKVNDGYRQKVSKKPSSENEEKFDFKTCNNEVVGDWLMVKT